MSHAVSETSEVALPRSAGQIRTYLVTELSKSLEVAPEAIDTGAPLDQLGVDSLMALGMAGGLASWLDRDVPATLMWDYRSIDAIAGALATQTSPRKLPPGVVGLQPHGNEIPIFGFPGLAGTPLAFAALASRLGEAQPFFGVAVPGYDGVLGSYYNVEEIASAMLKMIRQVQPTGPYRLAGTCFGGMLAYEAARQLVATGEQVTLLAIYDAFTPAGRRPKPVLRRFFVHLSQLLSGKTAWRELANKLHWSHLSVKASKSHPEYWMEPAPTDSANKKLWNINAVAAAMYRPEQYTGSIVWFGAAERSKYADFYKMMPCGGWSLCTTGGVTAVTLPGNHGSLIGPEHAQSAAAMLQPFLAEP